MDWQVRASAFLLTVVYNAALPGLARRLRLAHLKPRRRAVHALVRLVALVAVTGWLLPLLARHVAKVRTWRDELQERLGREATEEEWEKEMDRRMGPRRSWARGRTTG